MAQIRLRNTKSRKVEPFTPLDPENVRIYLCGPTVYDRAHLGNARNVIMFDVLYRLLRQVYGEGHVTYVRNFTDVDDKINATALARKEAGAEGTLEELVRERSEETIAWYLQDMDALGNLRPDHMPRATAYIPEMVAMIEDLIAKGHAYAKEGHVLFRVRSYKDYGALSGRSVEDMIAGARVEVAPFKEDPMDFVLWKPSTDDLPGWDSPWGRGRPGWHIECSAMADKLLWQDVQGALSPEALARPHMFDIHGGGNDLMFPHHENEIAQSCCAHGTEDLAQVWMHNEMLQVEGKKMSKSLGNFFTVRDLLDQGVPGEVIRFVFLSTHYSKPMDWTEKKAEEAKEKLRAWSTSAGETSGGTPDREVLLALADDLNTYEAILRLDQLYSEGRAADLVASAALLGIDLNAVSGSDWATPFEIRMPDGNTMVEGVDFSPTVGVIGWGTISQELVDQVLNLARKWLRYRREKDWENADNLRSQAMLAGIELRADRSENGVNGAIAFLQTGFDPSKLEGLL